MLGLNKLIPHPGQDDRSNPVYMLRSFGYVVPPKQCKCVWEKWEREITLRMTMRMRAFRGTSREELNTMLGECNQGYALLTDSLGYPDTHAAVAAIMRRKNLLEKVVKDLSDIYAFALELKLQTVWSDEAERIQEELKQKETLADLLRKAMTTPDENQE